MIYYSCSIILAVLATGNLTLADSLFLEGTDGQRGTSVEARLRLLNERRIVGVQFDLRLPGSQATARGALALEGMARHLVSSRVVAGRLRVVVHSTTNAELPTGGIVSLPLALNPNSPRGGPAFRIDNVIFTNAAGQNIPAEMYYHPLEAWRLGRFTEDQIDDPQVIGDSMDPDGDGFTNILEYLYSTNPLRADPPETAGRTLSRRLVSGPGGTQVPGPYVFSFDYPMAKGTDGVKLWIESTADLVRWDREPALPVQVGSLDSTTDQMRLTIESNPRTLPRLLFRLGMARSDEAVPQPVPGS